MIVLRPALKIAGAYALFGVIWILVSDHLLLARVPDLALFADLGLWKGLVFVFGTAFLIYLVAERHEPHTEENKAQAAADPRLWPLVLVFALLAAVIVLAGLGGAAYIAGSYRKIEIERLQAIADLKARQIADWHAERRGDAQVLREDDALSEGYWRWRKHDDPVVRDSLLKRLDAFRRVYGYRRVMLLDAADGPLLVAGTSPPAESAELRDTVRRAIAEQRILDTDLYRIEGPEAAAVRLEFVVPLPAVPARPPLAVVLDVEPERMLFPLVQSWPLPSASGETQLFRKDGGSILFLNEFRHRSGTALTMSVPASQSNKLAVQFAEGLAGPGGKVEGFDYRNVPALGVGKAIEGTGWYLVSKLDKEELYAQARRDGLWMLLVVSLALAAAAASARQIYRRREMGIAFVRLRQEREKAQTLQHLRQAEEQLRMLWLAVEQSPESIVITDLDARIEYANEAFTRVSGYSREEALGLNPRILQSGQTPAATYAELWEALSAGRTWQGELINRRKNGEIFVEWVVISPVRQADGRIAHYLAVKSDITEKKRLGHELDRHREHLEELVAERTAALERANREMESFSYSISHDLRAPLRAINGFAHALIESDAETLSREGRSHLDRVMHNASRMGQLIDDLLDFSRLGRTDLKRGAVDVDGLVREVVRDHAADYPKARVQVGTLPPANADKAMLRQVFDNLVGNALKYSARGDSPQIEIGARHEGGETVYFVRDNGAGFDMHYAGKLFGVFQRMHRESEFPGTGVGLAIVKQIVERHGGRVWAESAPERGAVFHFTLGPG